MTPPDRAHILTEQRNPRSMDLDELSVEQCLVLLHNEDRTALDAVGKAQPLVRKLIEAIEPRMREGGRLIYLGAGTSGRLGVLDASECPPTFQTDPGLIVGLIAGGDPALRTSSESEEDKRDGAHTELASLDLTKNDTVLGIAAGGTTPWVLGGLEFAHEKGGLTALLACTTIDEHPWIDHPIEVHTGPEVVTGSTRMKAGTATKLILNAISTTLMVRLGKVYENLMVDLRATNDKLTDRAARIISTVTGLDRDDAISLLDEANRSVKHAIVMRERGLSYEEADTALKEADGRLRDALNPSVGR